MGGSWQLKILHKLADLDIQRLDWDSAIETFIEISEVSPKNQKASISIVDLYFRLGNKAAAEKEIDRFMMLFDQSTEANSVQDYLTRLKNEIPNEDYIIKQLVRFYKGQNQTDQAISELDSLGDKLLESGDKKAAVQVIEEIIELSPQNIEAYQKLLGQLKD